MNVRPFGGRVLVKADKPRTRTKSGLHLPPSGSKTGGILRGTVIEIGMGGQNADGVTIPMRLEMDDRVLFIPDFGHSKLLLEDSDHYLLPEDGILAVITFETEDELGDVLDVKTLPTPKIFKG